VPMIRMYQTSNIDQAKDYFRQSLSKADYYIEGQETSGSFHGKIAERLFLNEKPVDKITFDLLCENINPITNQRLTPRTSINRRVGYDISFHCPKSVSILYGLCQEPQILDAFKDCVHEIMLEIETATQTRIRKNGQDDDRDTGEMLWCDFTHLTARPVENFTPDCHVHQHIFVFNLTYDSQEKRFKAGQFFQIKKDMPYYQARFLKRLADRYNQLGYPIRKTKNGFELASIPQKVIDHFSKRTNLISQVAKAKKITNPKALDQLGARTRGVKNNSLSLSQLRKNWLKQIEDEGIDKEKPEQQTHIEGLTPKTTVDFAISKAFTRNSVRRERQILAHAYQHAIDSKGISIDAIDIQLSVTDDLYKIKSRSGILCTTTKVREEEKQMIELARNGIGAFTGFDNTIVVQDHPLLGEEQQNALKHIMASKDFLTMVRGGAGTGKTALFKILVPLIENTGKQVFLFAPTVTASRDVLRQEGFEKSDTVFKLLNDKNLHQQIKDQVVLIDEAGMLGAKDTVQILELADNLKARIIFVGDPKQHSAVQRGDAMRILQTVGHIPYASLNTIYRQRQQEYREAVKQISMGDVQAGFEKLGENGAIHELPAYQISKVLTDQYMDVKEQGKTALVISPTRDNVRRINLDIRHRLKELGKLGKKEKIFTSYKNQYLDEVDKKDYRTYKQGMVIQAHQNLKHIQKGSVLNIVAVENKNVIVADTAGTNYVLPLDKAQHFDVYNPYPIYLSNKDEIKITKNSFDLKRNRLDNGTTLKVIGFTKNGDIKAVRQMKTKKRPIILSKTHGNFDYAYCSTSYSAQGNTVDHVIIGQPAITFPASNLKQFYVSISRGREAVTIFTDDKQDLLNAISQSGDRQGALELFTNNYDYKME